MDPGYIEQIENRLVFLHQCMQQVSDKKQQVEDADKQSKINELYELSKKVDELSTTLPQVVERLVSLKELHEQGNFFFPLNTHTHFRIEISSGKILFE